MTSQCDVPVVCRICRSASLPHLRRHNTRLTQRPLPTRQFCEFGALLLIYRVAGCRPDDIPRRAPNSQKQPLQTTLTGGEGVSSVVGTHRSNRRRIHCQREAHLDGWPQRNRGAVVGGRDGNNGWRGQVGFCLGGFGSLRGAFKTPCEQ